MYLYCSFAMQEEIDRESNLESVPNMIPNIDWLFKNSEKTRAELKCQFDQRFGSILEEAVDVYPARQPDASILIFVHGGWRQYGSSKEFSLVARGAVAHDVTVVVTNYLLCPKVSVTEISRQSPRALARVYKHATGFSVDPDRILVVGHSAGGAQARLFDQPGKDHITAIAGLEDPESPPCRAMLDFMRHRH